MLLVERTRSGFARLVPVLQGHKHGFERAKQCDRTKHDDGDPQNEMKPHRWRKRHFHPKCQSRDDRADDKNHEDRRPVATVLRAEI